MNFLSKEEQENFQNTVDKLYKDICSISKEEQERLDYVISKSHREIYSKEINTDQLIQLIFEKFVNNNGSLTDSDDEINNTSPYDSDNGIYTDSDDDSDSDSNWGTDESLGRCTYIQMR